MAGAQNGRGRDPEFDAAMLPLLDTVYDFARRLTGNPAEAQDLTQETYLRAFSAFASFERGTSARAWLLAISRNCHRNRLRAAARHPEEELEDEDALPAHEAYEPASWETINEEDLDLAIQRLPLHHREMIIARDLHGLAYKEISTMMGLPVGTVMSRLHRARTALKSLLLWRVGGRAARRRAR